MMARFKGVPKFDLSLRCSLCEYKIHPSEIMRMGSHLVKCPNCGEIFDELGGKKAAGTS
jgi:rubredoxin